jgi:integrase
MTMGRKRTSNFDLPPRMHKKGDCYYYVTTTSPRKWIRLDKSLPVAKQMWASLEGAGTPGTFESLANRFLAECTKDLAANTRRNYNSHGNILIAVFGEMQLSEIKPHHIGNYLDRHSSPMSANIQIGLMSTMFERAMRWGMAETNPCKGVRRNKMKPRDRYITDDEYRAIRNKCPEWLQIAMDISLLTGLRESDVLKIRLADIDENHLYVQQKKTGKRQAYILNEALSSAIAKAKTLAKSHQVRSLFLLPTSDGKQYPDKLLQAKFREARDTANVKDVVFHDIRGKAATDGKGEGLDYQALLGHSKRDMSDRYVKARATDKVSPRNKEL